jgi:hypothetical protein
MYMMRSIFYIWLILSATIALYYPEVVGQWEAKRDIAYEAAWEETVP